MQDLNLSGKDFRGKSAMIQKNNEKEIDPSKLLCENSRHTRHVLRSYILRNSILPYKCDICGISQWQGKTLSLELDHINGVNNDNRLENLRFLCPNCHSQTTTYGARNTQRVESKYETSDDLKQLIINSYIELKNRTKVASKYNLNRNAVKQVLSEAGLINQKQKYVIQYDSNHNEIRRFGCLAECCRWLMDNNLVTTKVMKTCRNTLNKNKGILWKNYYFEILDA